MQAACYIVLGAAAGLLYDVFRAIRRRTGRIAAAALDFLFCAAVFSAFFLLGFAVSGGRHRAFYLLITALGGGLYFLSLSPLSLFLCSAAVNLMARGAAAVRVCVKKSGIFIKNVFSSVIKRYRIATHEHRQPGNTEEMQLKRYTRIVILLLSLVVISYAVVRLASTQARIRDAEKTNSELSAQIAEREVSNAELEHYIENSSDDEVIAGIARDELGLVEPGEKVFYDSGS